MASDFIIRDATELDVDTLVAFRGEMFRDMGWLDDMRLAELEPLYADYVTESSARGDFHGWIAEADGVAVGAVGLLWERVPPTVRNLSGKQAYILGLYVAEGHRRRGIARSLLEHAVRFAREGGADVVSLHYSPAGRGLYESFGFKESPEMRLFTDPDSAAWAPQAPSHTAADDAD
jgi:ribosomal protein S18 acetylase RimI-like enzyme